MEFSPTIEEAWRYVQSSSRGPARTDVGLRVPVTPVWRTSATSVSRDAMVAALVICHPKKPRPPTEPGREEPKEKEKDNLELR